MATDYDVFNGDADGLCALTQLRLAEPRPGAQLVTGVKRDIQLLNKLQFKAQDRVTVLDISLDKNRDGLLRALEAGAGVFYADHHFAGDIPEHKNLQALINTGSDVCTSLLVNGHLGGRFAAWAVVGSFGDNLKASAVAAAKPLSLSDTQLQTLEKLGIYINYNGYGAALEDLHFSPAELYRLISEHRDPFAFIDGNRAAFDKLEQGYHQDMTAAADIKPEVGAAHAAVFVLPDASWARRVSGVYSNDLANDNPARAHAVVTEKSNGNYLVSVRAPLSNKTGADEICRQFATGGGRAAAAGINDLPADQMQTFVTVFTDYYRKAG